MGPRATAPSVLSRSLDLHEELLDGLPVGVIGLSEDERIILYNRQQTKFSGLRREEVLGEHLFESIAPFTLRLDLRENLKLALPPTCEASSIRCSLQFRSDADEIEVILHFVPLAFSDRRMVSIIVEDISEQHRLQRERDRLLSAMFHDLRAPLSGISLFADVCTEGTEADRGELMEAFHQVGSVCKDMIQLIDQTTRQLQGGAKGDDELLDLAFLTHGMTLESALICRMDGLHLSVNGLEVEIGNEGRVLPVRIVASRVEASRCVRNLIGNAAKYAKQRIDISVFAEDGKAILTVEDDGPGVPDDFEDKVFEGGVRAPGAKPGTGLGLETVKLWVDSMHGSVSVGRSALGGAVFRVELPSGDV